MSKKTILRVCHKFLIDNDGYDLDIQDLCKSTNKFYTNYVITYIDCSIKEYVKKNNLSKVDDYFYHKKLRTYIIPIEYRKKHGTYLKDLYLYKNIVRFNRNYKKTFKTLKPDILHIHGTLLIQFLYSAIISKKKCLVISTHHIGLINNNYHKQKLHILFFKQIVHNLFPFFCNKILCVSNYGKKSFFFLKNKIKVINPVPIILENNDLSYQDIIKKNVLNNKFNINPSDKIFCCIGRISRQKNQLSIVKAFNNVVSKYSNYKLIIVGKKQDSKYYDLMLKEISKFEDNFCLIESLPNDRVVNLIKNADFLISTTMNEGLGRTVMEAQLMGKSVIASKNSGYDDFINDGENGLLVDPHKIKDIETAILAIKKVKNKKEFSHKDYIRKIIGIYGGN